VERENSISCETQLEYCKTMIRPEEYGEEVLTFVDNGFSGGNMERDSFQKMMRQLEQGRIRKLIVYRLDRISRSLSDFVGILETLKKYDVRFVSSQESFDTSSPYGEMIVKILMVFAEFERQSIIERVTQAYAHRSEKGFFMGGRTPYGFRLTETEIGGIRTKMLVPAEKEIRQIRFIFENYASAGTTLRGLVDMLTEKRMFPTYGVWSTARLSVILKNPVYVRADNAVFTYFAAQNANIISDIRTFDGIHGIQMYGGTKHTAEDMSDIKIVVMRHEGIISSDIWLYCREKLGKNRQFGTASGNGTSWLGGMIVCKNCGRTMTVTKGGKRIDGSYRRYFNCTGKTHSRMCTGPLVTIYADSLEKMVFALIQDKLSALYPIRTTVSEKNAGKQNHLKNRLTEIVLAQEKLTDVLLRENTNTDLLELINEKARKLAEEKRSTEEQLRLLTLETEEMILPLQLTDGWEKAEFQQKRAVCRLLMEKIYIHPDGTAEVVWNL